MLDDWIQLKTDTFYIFCHEQLSSDVTGAMENWLSIILIARLLAGFIAVWAMLADTPSREPAADFYSEPKLKA